jgi:hypothetical protein
MWQHVFESGKSIIRIYSMYESLRLFLMLGALLFIVGSFGIGRWLWFYFTEPNNTGHVQSLIISAVLVIVGFQIGLIGLLSDLVAINRKLIEDALYRLKKIELKDK